MKNRSIGIFLSYGYTFLNMICSLVMSSFLLRSLGDTEYGLYQTVSAFATYLVMLEFGTGTVMSRNIALARSKGEEKQIKNNISTVWYTTVFLSLIIILISVVFCLNIGNIYSKSMTLSQVSYSQKIFVIMTGYLIISFFTNNLNGILLGMEQYTFANAFKIVKIALRTTLLFVIISFKSLAVIIAAVDLFVGLLVFVITYFYCKRKYSIKFKLKYFKKDILIESLPLCLALLLQAVINQANSSVDKFVIGIKMSLEAVSLYSVAQYIYALISTITTIPISMYMPQVAKDISAGLKGKELTKTLVAPCRLVVLIGGTLLFGFVAVGNQFIGIFYGVSKQEAWIYALVTCIPMFVNMTNGVIINVLDVLNKRLARSLSLAGTTVLNIILTLVLISKWGILGAVIGTAVSLILGNIIVMNIYYKKVLKLNVVWLYLQAYKGLLPSQVISGIISLFVARVIDNIYISFFCGGVLFVILAGVMTLGFGFNDEEKAKFKVITKKFLLRTKKVGR